MGRALLWLVFGFVRAVHHPSRVGPTAGKGEPEGQYTETCSGQERGLAHAQPRILHSHAHSRTPTPYLAQTGRSTIQDLHTPTRSHPRTAAHPPLKRAHLPYHSQVGKSTIQDPQRRLDGASSLMQRSGFSPNTTLQAWGFAVDPRMVEVRGPGVWGLCPT